MSKLKSEGKCVYCQKNYSGSGISRHLGTHLKALEKEQNTSSKAYHLKVSAHQMFLHLLIGGNETLDELDDFLRAIWLECCGHMSSFEVKDKNYHVDWGDYNAQIGEDKSQSVGKVFKKGLKINYQYDFGTTTHLKIVVVNEYEVKGKKGIELLTRNEPLEILCHVCKAKPAVDICSICIYDGEGFLCKSCSKKHAKTCSDFGDYAKMPVVNSPRMGDCAYMGGSLDKKRDGAWKNN